VEEVPHRGPLDLRVDPLGEQVGLELGGLVLGGALLGLEAFNCRLSCSASPSFAVSRASFSLSISSSLFLSAKALRFASLSALRSRSASALSVSVALSAPAFSAAVTACGSSWVVSSVSVVVSVSVAIAAYLSTGENGRGESPVRRHHGSRVGTWR
jgi:hypothetical protein